MMRGLAWCPRAVGLPVCGSPETPIPAAARGTATASGPLGPPNFSGAAGLFSLKRHQMSEQLPLIQPCGKSSRLGSKRWL